MTNKETKESEIVNGEPISEDHAKSEIPDESNHHRHRLALGVNTRFQLPIIITSLAASVLLCALVSSTPAIP